MSRELRFENGRAVDARDVTMFCSKEGCTDLSLRFEKYCPEHLPEA